MKFLLKLATLLLMIIATNLQAQVEDPFVRFPALSPDGTELAFEYQGDIWKVAAEGGLAYRLTVHEGYDAWPQWSPDGSEIAFSGRRYGHTDVFVTGKNGGFPKRLTHHSAGDNVSGWTPDGNILFTTRRTFAQVEREHEIYKISPDGGTPYRIMDAVGYMPEWSPDKKFIAFVMGSCKIEREDYRGPANKDLWLFDTESGRYIQLTNFDGNEFMPHWAGNNTIYYISPKSGKYNIHKLTIDGEGRVSADEQITTYTDDGPRYFSISRNGQKLAFERQTSIYLMDLPEGKPRKADIKISADYVFDPVEYETFTGKISEYAVSPNGKYSAFVVRGEIFVTENNDKSKTVSISDSPWRDRDVAWFNDTTLLFTSDREGQYEMYLAMSSDDKEPDLFKTLKRKLVRITNTPEEEMNPVVSPDGKKIVYQKGHGKMVVAELSDKYKLTGEVVLQEGWDTPSGVTWSPDSRWLAYSLGDLDGNEEIFIQPVDKSHKPVNVSMHPRGDYSPFWSKDGSKLGFISIRNNGDADIWFAWLKKSDWEKTREDWEELIDEQDEKTEKGEKGKKDKEDKAEPILIDLERIHERLVQVTALPGNESDLLISHDGETFYFVSNRNSRQSFRADNDLYSVKWNGRDLKQLTKNNARPYGVKLSPGGKKLFMLRSGGKLYSMPVKSEKMEPVPFAANMRIDYETEQEQIFEEAWRSLDQRFYDPDFHGKDWDALKKKYKPWAMKASTYYDFRDITNFMLGELNASHMDLRGGRGRYETESERTGRPGIEVKPVKNGVMITDIVMNGPADKEASKLYEGEIIRMVNGEQITASVNFWKTLTNTAGKQILLEVENTGGDIREVVIRPATSIGGEIYNDWVEARKKLTEAYSGGRLGYIHIQGMNWPSFERFERELAASGAGKEGIVIDVRYNGGGWTTDYLMTVLNVDQHAYCVPRGAAEDLSKQHEQFKDHYPFGERLPFSAWTRPSIALCNANSYSNAEIFSHAYKTLGLGTLVGIPTFGAVISTGANGLLDGSYVRLPSRAWYVKTTGENMENGPAVPDIILDNPPDSKANNRDEQLKRAVDELLRQIDSGK